MQYVPLASLLVETDAPYLAPEPHRGKRNEPSYVVKTAEKIAELKGLSYEEVADATTENAKTLFGLKSKRQDLLPENSPADKYIRSMSGITGTQGKKRRVR